MDSIVNYTTNSTSWNNISLNFSSFNKPPNKFDILRIQLNMILLPIIITVGITGNCLAFYVLNKSPLKHQSSSVYLAYLALVDAGFLVCLSFVWIDFLLDNPITMTNGLCQLLPFLTYVFGFLSVYTVVAFTVERFIVTYFPLRRHFLCTRKRAKITLIILTLGSMLFYSCPLYMTTVYEHRGKSFCVLKSRFIFVGHLLAYIDTILTLVLPAVIILVLNGAIGVRLVHIFSDKSDAYLGRQKMSISSSGKGSYSQPSSSDSHRCSVSNGCTKELLINGKHTSPSANSRQAAAHTTRTLVILSTLFVLLNLPSHALRVYALMMSLMGTPQKSVVLYITQELMQFVFYVNFASNYFLYSLCFKNFRETAKKTVLRQLFCNDYTNDRYVASDLELNMRRKSMSQRTDQTVISK